MVGVRPCRNGSDVGYLKYSKSDEKGVKRCPLNSFAIGKVHYGFSLKHRLEETINGCGETRRKLL